MAGYVFDLGNRKARACTMAGKRQKKATKPVPARTKHVDSGPVKAPPSLAKARHGELPGDAGPPVVGIGASAGGLEALKKFFAAMPADSGIAFVLIPHLDPTHESLMTDLLARHTHMPVLEAAEGTRSRSESCLCHSTQQVHDHQGPCPAPHRPGRAARHANLH